MSASIDREEVVYLNPLSRYLTTSSLSLSFQSRFKKLKLQKVDNNIHNFKFPCFDQNVLNKNYYNYKFKYLSKRYFRNASHKPTHSLSVLYKHNFIELSYNKNLFCIFNFSQTCCL